MLMLLSRLHECGELCIMELIRSRVHVSSRD
jgi:hypothetical protein